MLVLALAIVLKSVELIVGVYLPSGLVDDKFPPVNVTVVPSMLLPLVLGELAVAA
jgi:hypothetical protein